MQVRNRHAAVVMTTDGVVRIWKYNENRTIILVKSFTGHSQRVFNVAWHPSVYSVLASGGDDGTIRVW